ncbi:hypothetical protein [Microvirga puerhi]|uniref:YtxH domain-containing protein n=1 Tax=Microvirga puerhi TaxID=2876078 RepID=A0ABS7VV76_9HYPH|nr:hypothetical protein [Microvirga puerhi]MBZ6079030.1 hypothetical protein [Microvirga puerhi]
MAKPLSELLTELSARAKNAEDHVAAAQQEAHDKIAARREQSRAAVETAITKVNQDIKSAGETAADKWKSLQAKVAADMEALKENMAQRKHERDVKHAENRAERLEWEAALAIDYAAASIEQAELAVYDAIIGRVEVAQARNA